MQLSKLFKSDNTDVVGEIEKSYKPASTAEGLYLHENSGKIQTYAKPVKAIQMFKYDLTRHIIMRHFYLRGLNKAKKMASRRV